MNNHKNYINLIKNQSIQVGELNNHIVYQYQDKYLYFWIDENNNYIDGMQYTIKNEIGWTWITPKEFYEKHINKDNKLQFIEYLFRKYGQPKLSKPKELKGVKQAFSVDYIVKKCKCQVFIKDNDIWVKHGDYFSPSMKVRDEDMGMPLEVLCKKYLGKDKSNKFIYPDAWGDIVLKQEAWIKLENLVYRLQIGELELDLLNQILRQQEKVCGFKDYDLCCTDMERFWENVIKETKKCINNINND